MGLRCKPFQQCRCDALINYVATYLICVSVLLPFVFMCTMLRNQFTYLVFVTQSHVCCRFLLQTTSRLLTVIICVPTLVAITRTARLVSNSTAHLPTPRPAHPVCSSSTYRFAVPSLRKAFYPKHLYLNPQRSCLAPRSPSAAPSKWRNCPPLQLMRSSCGCATTRS